MKGALDIAMTSRSSIRPIVATVWRGARRRTLDKELRHLLRQFRFQPGDVHRDEVPRVLKRLIAP